MHQGVVSDAVSELLVLFAVREIAVQKQIAYLQVVAAGSQLINGVAAVKEHASGSVNKGNAGIA